MPTEKQDPPKPIFTFPPNLKFSTTKVSADLFGDNATVSFISLDGVVFSAQAKHFKATTGGFPSQTPSLQPKDSRRIPPTLEDIRFPLLMRLAEAAEKYVVYSAIAICMMKMKDFLPENAEKIFYFAVEHNRESLYYPLALSLVHKPLSEIVFKIPSKVYIPWSLYREQWLQTLSYITELGPTTQVTCPHNNQSHEINWKRRIHEVYASAQIAANPSDISNFNFHDLFDVNSLGACDNFSVHWRGEVEAKINEMKDFKSFVLECKAQATSATISATPAQTFLGIGGSGAWWPNDLFQFPESVRQNLSSLLFSQSGLGLSSYRFNAGAGGVGVDNPTRAPETFYASNFGVPGLTMFANSAPAPLTVGGTSFRVHVLEPGTGEAYGIFLADVVQHFRSQEILINLISPMNEPDNSFGPAPCGQEGMLVLPTQHAEVVNGLWDALNARNMTDVVGILADETSHLSLAVLEYPFWLSQVIDKITALAHHTYDFPSDLGYSAYIADETKYAYKHAVGRTSNRWYIQRLHSFATGRSYRSSRQSRSSEQARSGPGGPSSALRTLFPAIPGGAGKDMTRDMDNVDRIRAGPAQGGKRPEDRSPQELHAVLAGVEGQKKVKKSITA
ncbi:hypothetical protein K435DRAFT_973553 [Dendrothele bispora CBS 962.96]|uniref:Endo-beta-1,6-galactanase-like domain-containing protein n=1 Tax=Dendrothele bispora (strain CBS 962.96) TaxID=1314807 RepID=A0A4S8KRZ1_DENBC|nr:hypothetical protein K435DRAFT_973553 [Dendrothele bispora CBS 962.96]